MSLYCLSLWQPWASLIIFGEKRYETRDWSPRGLRKGDKIVIHAAKRWQKTQAEVCRLDPFATILDRNGVNPEEPQLPLGCALGIVTFGGYWRSEDLVSSGRLSPIEKAFGNFEPNRFGWHFTLNQVFEIPVPLKGQQGLFRVNLR